MNEPLQQRPLGIALAAVVLITAGLTAAMVASATSSAELSGSGDAPDLGLAAGERASASIEVPAMVPGQTARSCVTIGPSPESGDDVVVHGRATGPLADHLLIDLRRGEPGASCDAPGRLTTVFSGPVELLGAAPSPAAHAGQESSSTPYVVDVTLDDRTPNAAQGAGATLDISWEVRPAPDA